MKAKLYQEDDYLIMRSTKPIQAGEEIFNDYGPLPRSDLLRMYGYVTSNYAQYDVVEFSFDLLEETAGKKHNDRSNTWLNRKTQLDDWYDSVFPNFFRLLFANLLRDSTSLKFSQV